MSHGGTENTENEVKKVAFNAHLDTRSVPLRLCGFKMYIAHRKELKERKAEIDNAVIQREGKIRVAGLSIGSLCSRAALKRAEPGAEKRYG